MTLGISARLVLAALASYAFFDGPARAASPKLYYQETKHVKVIFYDPAHEYLVQHLIRCFEAAYEGEKALFQYEPQQVAVLLEDFSDFGHGSAGTVPKNFVTLALEPVNYTFETLPANERIQWIINHELVHIITGDVASGRDRLMRRLFGGKTAVTPDDPISIAYSALSSPRAYAPRWYQEGIAAFMETWMGGGMGRALGGYDEMTFRAMVRDEAYIYTMLGLESQGTAVDFQVSVNAYLYGTRFMTHLVRQYGPDKLMEWMGRREGSKPYFTTQFHKIYGVSIHDEWNRWIEAERAWQTANLARIREFPVTKTTPVRGEALGSVSRTYYDPARNVLYGAVRSVGKMAHLAALHLDTGEVEHLQDIRGAALYYVSSMTYDPKRRRIFYSSDHANWRDLNVFDLETRKSKRLIRDSRIGDLVYSPADDAIWGVRHHNGLASIVRIPAPFDHWQEAYVFQYGTDLFDVDISPDGRFLTGAMSDLTGHARLVQTEIAGLKNANANFEMLHDFEFATPGNFVFSPDGKYLYGSSYYTGVSNLWRYDRETRKADILSNCETGLFRPLPFPDGRLLAYEYTAKGFAPVFVDAKPLQDVNAIQYLGQATVEKYPQLRAWKLPSPAGVNLTALNPKSGLYSPAKQLSRASIYPIVQGYKDSPAAGFRATFADSLGLATVNATFSYSPDTSLPAKERVHVGVEGRLWQLKLSGYYNRADFYDLFGPTKFSRKGYSVAVENSHNLVFDTPRRVDFNWGLAGYGGMDRLPDAQNVAVTHSRFLTAKLGLRAESLERSLAAVDDEKGYTWSLNARGAFTGKVFPRLFATYDRGWMLPMRNSSLWLRGAAGKSFGNRQEPFANFYFGGFGNNWVDHQEISRYRQYYAFPGVELNEIGASNFGKGLVEWNLPPVRFKHLGMTAAYCNWARLSLFSSGLFTNLASARSRGVYGNVGAQLDFRIMLFTFLNSTFSTGYAVATDKNGHVSSEYMVSLKIL